MKKFLKPILVGLLTISTLAAISLFWGYQQLANYTLSELMLAEEIELKVSPGSSISSLASQLEKTGYIQDSWKLKLWVKLHPELANIRTGLYQVTPKDNLNTLLKKLNQGDEKIFSVTLIEGQSIKEWQLILSQLPHMLYQEDIFEQVLAANGDKSGLPEGKFYPDTYHYHAGDSLDELLNRSYLKMQQQLESIWEGRDKNIPLKSPYELLILASIIEKETGKASERPWISAVFTNRLNKGMRLQTDPTVIYGMGDSYKGDITYRALREKTPFNTYRINGLTPTPIAAPSGASLTAAAHPADVDYLYFVSKNDGSHIFSKTLAEHNRAVNRYQRRR